MYRLHCFCQSGNSYKVAFLLRALGQAYENVFVDFMRGATRDESWRAGTNAKGAPPRPRNIFAAPENCHDAQIFYRACFFPRLRQGRNRQVGAGGTRIGSAGGLEVFY